MFLPINEREAYKAEIEELKSLLSKHEKRRLELAGDKAQLQAELELTKELLEDARAAKKNDCLRGPYCRYCKHSVMDYTNREKCVCTFGTCKHFEKERGYEPD